jgi:hypothetical protein
VKNEALPDLKAGELREILRSKQPYFAKATKDTALQFIPGGDFLRSRINNVNLREIQHMTVKHLLFLTAITFTNHLVPMKESLHDVFPNEVVRMFLEHMSHRQRTGRARVSKLWRFLVASFPSVSTPGLSPLFHENTTFFRGEDPHIGYRTLGSLPKMLHVCFPYQYDGLSQIDNAISEASVVAQKDGVSIEKIRIAVHAVFHEVEIDALDVIKKIMDENKETPPVTSFQLFTTRPRQWRNNDQLCQKFTEIPSITDVCLWLDSLEFDCADGFISKLKNCKTNIDTVEVTKGVCERLIISMYTDKGYTSFLTTCSSAGIKRLKGLPYSKGLCDFIKNDTKIVELYMVGPLSNDEHRNISDALRENSTIQKFEVWSHLGENISGW